MSVTELISTKPEEWPSVVLFIDCINSVQISSSYEIREYEKFVSRLQLCYASVLHTFGIVVNPTLDRDFMRRTDLFDKLKSEVKHQAWDIRGDEMCLVLAVPEERLAEAIHLCVALGLETQLRWLQHEPNITRIADRQEPLRLAGGIHAGLLSWRDRSFASRGEKATPEGYALNFAKRVEAAARAGNWTRMYFSREARYSLVGTAHDVFAFSPEVPLDLKGLGMTYVSEIVLFVRLLEWVTGANVDVLEQLCRYDVSDIALLGVTAGLLESHAVNGKERARLLVTRSDQRWKDLKRLGLEKDFERIYEEFQKRWQLPVPPETRS